MFSLQLVSQGITATYTHRHIGFARVVVSCRVMLLALGHHHRCSSPRVAATSQVPIVSFCAFSIILNPLKRMS